MIQFTCPRQGTPGENETPETLVTLTDSGVLFEMQEYTHSGGLEPARQLTLHFAQLRVIADLGAHLDSLRENPDDPVPVPTESPRGDETGPTV